MSNGKFLRGSVLHCWRGQTSSHVIEQWHVLIMWMTVFVYVPTFLFSMCFFKSMYNRLFFPKLGVLALCLATILSSFFDFWFLNFYPKCSLMSEIKKFIISFSSWSVWRSQSSNISFKKHFLALAGVSQWIERRPVNQKVSGSVPSQGTCLGCGPGPQLGRARGNR